MAAALAIDASHVYWGHSVDGVVFEAPYPKGKPVELVAPNGARTARPLHAARRRYL
jgi:hypothetical protein